MYELGIKFVRTEKRKKRGKTISISHVSHSLCFFTSYSHQPYPCSGPILRALELAFMLPFSGVLYKIIYILCVELCQGKTPRTCWHAAHFPPSPWGAFPRASCHVKVHLLCILYKGDHSHAIDNSQSIACLKVNRQKKTWEKMMCFRGRGNSLSEVW